MKNTPNEALARFNTVVNARTSIRDQIDLLLRLTVSDKFTEDVKPKCFSILLHTLLEKLSNRVLHSFLQAVGKSKAFAYLRADASLSDETTKLQQAIIKKIFQYDSANAEELCDMFFALERNGICTDRGHTLDLALQAGISEDVLGKICDLTFNLYYGLVAERTEPVHQPVNT